jgi:hypothetical protein
MTKGVVRGNEGVWFSGDEGVWFGTTSVFESG